MNPDRHPFDPLAGVDLAGLTAGEAVQLIVDVAATTMPDMSTQYYAARVAAMGMLARIAVERLGER